MSCTIDPILANLYGHLPDVVVDTLLQAFRNDDRVVSHDGPLVLELDMSRRDGVETTPEYRALYIGAKADARFRGRALGAVKWAVASAASRDVAHAPSGKTLQQVFMRPCADQYGQRIAGGALDCIVDDGVTISSGDTIGYVYDADATPVGVCYPDSKVAESIQYGRVQAGYDNRVRCSGATEDQ